MKKWTLLALCAITSLAFAKATLRQTSEAQNRTTPPPEGELVYAVQEDGSVVAYVGQYARALPLVDGSALRLARSTAFEESELDIAFEGTMSGSNYGPGTITITHIHKERIGEVTWSSGMEGMMPGSANATVELKGHVAIVTISSGNIDALVVYPEITLPSVDLVNRDALLIDKRGSVRFGDLRDTLYRDLSQEENGHWARYTARAPVDLGKHPLLFGVGSGSAVRGAAGTLSLYAGSLPALTATATNTEGSLSSGAITITDLKMSESTVTITAFFTGIDETQVRLQHRDALSSGEWMDVASPTITKNVDGSIAYSFPRTTGSSGFWRLYAGDEVVSLVVTVHCDLAIEGGLILTSPNGSRYRITVSDAGALEATAL